MDEDLAALEGRLAAEGLLGRVPRDAPRDPLVWYAALRWAASGGQVLVVLGGAMFGPWLADAPWLLAVPLLVALSNVVVTFRVRRRPLPGWVLSALLVTDVVALTASLAPSGGAENPFSVFFLVYVTVAAMLLPRRQVWAIVGLVAIAIGVLFATRGTGLSAHAVGMGGSYLVAAAFLAHYVGTIAHAIRERDERLAEARQAYARLAVLTTFSANAAHELGTPLGTIVLASEELVRTVDRGDREALRADASLVHAEALRCKHILRELSSRAGQSSGEMPSATTVDVLAREVREVLGEALASRVTWDVPEAALSLVLHVPRRTLAQSIANLVRNGLEANDTRGSSAPVTVRVEGSGDTVTMAIEDDGAGIPADAKVGEPFVSTKGGLGLGVYLARTLAETLGGVLRFDVAGKGRGTIARLSLPALPEGQGRRHREHT